MNAYHCSIALWVLFLAFDIHVCQSMMVEFRTSKYTFMAGDTMAGGGCWVHRASVRPNSESVGSPGRCWSPYMRSDWFGEQPLWSKEHTFVALKHLLYNFGHTALLFSTRVDFFFIEWWIFRFFKFIFILIFINFFFTLHLHSVFAHSLSIFCIYELVIYTLAVLSLFIAFLHNYLR